MIYYALEKKYLSLKLKNTKIIMSSRKHQRFFEDYYIPSYGIKEDIDLLHLPQNGLGLSSEGTLQNWLLFMT